MDAEPNLLHPVDPELLLHHLPDVGDGDSIRSIRQPYGDLVTLTTDIDGPASDELGMFLRLFAYQEEEDLQRRQEQLLWRQQQGRK